MKDKMLKFIIGFAMMFMLLIIILPHLSNTNYLPSWISPYVPYFIGVIFFMCVLIVLRASK